MKRRNKIILIFFAVLLALFVAGYLALIHFGLLELLINRELRARIEGNLPLKVSIGDISGDYLSDLVVKDIYVIYSDSAETYTLAYIPYLNLKYSVGRFWRREIVFEKISLDSASFMLKQSRENIWLFPAPRKKSERKFRIFDFEIREIALDNLKLTLDMISDSLMFHDINLNARVEAREETYSAIIRQFSCLSSDSKYNLVLDSGRVTLTEKDIVFQDLMMKTDSSNLELAGHINYMDGLKANIQIAAENLNLTELSSFINARLKGNLKVVGVLQYGGRRVDADVVLSGIFFDRNFDSVSTAFSYLNRQFTLDTLSGSIFDGCYFDGHGNIDFSTQPTKYHLVGIIRHFNLNNLVFDSYRSDFNGKMNLNGRGLKGEDMVLDIDADLDESWFDEYHVHKIIGYMTITTDSIVFHDRFGIKYHDNFILAGGRLDYDGPLNIEGTADFKDLSVFNGQTFIERMGGRGTAEFYADGDLADPDIRGRFESDSLWIYEIFSNQAAIDVDVDRFLFDRSGDINVILKDGQGYDIPYDTLYSSMFIDSHFVYLDTFYFDNKYTHGNAKGVLDYASYPQKLTVNEIELSLMDLLFNNDVPMIIDIDSAGYEFVNCRLKRPIGFIEAQGRTNYDESMDLKINCEEINISPWIALYLKDYPIAGRISGELNLAGDFLSPRMKFAGRIDSLSYRKYILGNLFGHLNYRDENVKIDSVTLISRKGYYFAQGELPINLAFTDVDNRFLDIEQNIRINARDERFDLVGLLMDEVDSLTGDFNANINLSGTLLKPKLNGKASIRNGNLKLYELILPLENLYADLTMIDEKIYLDSISATCKNGRRQTGTVKCTGDISVLDIDTLDYNVDLSLRQFPARYELGDVSGDVDGDLSVRGVTPPTVYGDVQIIRADYLENFEEGNEGWVIMSEIERENSWNLNLNVEANSNLWVKNDDIDAELSGNINFIKESGIYRFIGSLEILRGRGYLADRVFRLEPGAVIIYEDIEYPNPRLDIYATTEVRQYDRDPVTGDYRGYNKDLRIHLTGTLDEPIINVAENSEFSNEEMLELLFAYYTPTKSDQVDDAERVGDRFITGLTGILSSEFGKIGTRTLRSIGVETFEIDPAYEETFDPLGTRVTLGFYTSPNLYIYGRSSISMEAGEAGFEYRLGRLFQMEGRVDENNLYRLFLNFYWDY